MSLTITYFAPTTSMGDTSKEDAAAYRIWAKQEIETTYPEAQVFVLNQDSTVQVEVEGCRSFEEERIAEDIKDFVHRLWDKCPWNFD